MTIQQPRLLFVDSYDSFTFNLANLCRLSIPDCVIHIIKNDEFTIEELLPKLSYFSAIIVGPGPGSPGIPQDIGLVKDLWKMKEECLLPIFGVCLGLQSLALEFGAHLSRLRVVKHGQVSKIHHVSADLFEAVQMVEAVRYHSLHVKLSGVEEIEELAWAHDEDNGGRVTMAIKHKVRPFWAVQYHPESVCTEGGGIEVIQNFWKLAQAWMKQSHRKPKTWNSTSRRAFGNLWPHRFPRILPLMPLQTLPTVSTVVITAPDISITDACELLGVMDPNSPFVLLDSAAKPGRFSIIGSLRPSSLRILYFLPDTFVTLRTGESTVREDLGNGDIWSWIAIFMRSRKAKGCTDIPFWGGLIGYLSYELGVHSLQVAARTKKRRSQHPDVNLVFVERSIVVDSETGLACVQSLIPGDNEWIFETATRLREMTSRPIDEPRKNTEASVELPDKSRYISRINRAKEHLFSGDSYELCLTTPTRISILNSTTTPWERYKTLRRKNPAPHSAYLCLPPSTLLSSSPERFLSFSRPPNSVCQLRPIKGTVRKAPGITRAVAEELLAGSTKEVAENLMIVDLIRHDLHGVVGENVQVKQFCAVEEYETVWQLVSVIEGKVVEGSATHFGSELGLGWEVLRKSLPPGSMTGAPKKRSVEILQALENCERSLYSGVFGYWCVGGSGDWSVTIRSCFQFDSEFPDGLSNKPGSEEWTIGAGGAITALSDAEAEWDEMVVKLQSVLAAFFLPSS